MQTAFLLAHKKHQQGVTLLEALLVLVIGMSILYLSLQQYFSYRRDADVVSLQSNVNLLFQALGHYYQAHCNDGSSGLSRFSSAGFVSVSVPTLIKEGFLRVPNDTLQQNPIVNSAGSNQGYILQFNQLKIGGLLPDRTAAMSDKGFAKIGEQIVWQAQVAVHLDNADTAPQYKNLLAADCLSNASKNSVTPCSTSGDTGNYAVWGRSPSYPSAGGTSNLWLTMPRVRNFNQMYTTDPIGILVVPSQSAQRDLQFFVCGPKEGYI